ncbi:monooxygenase [Irpex rosettiformis]|uniref:Monooxygenase n=1 Tax=Irpex rosettiformis TaxID=378272 RepID=A0ACB8U9Q0_9APHY|nr:monooxygenase [Irpex rosettiformis]
MATPSGKPSVLIAGAGPSGLILALTLTQNHVPVRILDKETSPRIGQRGAGIQPRTLELFHFLGVLPDVLKRTFSLPMICRYKMPEGIEPTVKYHLVGEPWTPTPDIPYPNALMLGQSNYEAILRDHLAKAGVQVELGMELTTFEQDNNGVTATVVRHESGVDRSETICADWLVCADGGKSHARKALGLTFLGETRDSLHVVVADAEVSGLSPEYWHSWGNFGSTSLMVRATEDPSIFNFVMIAPPSNLSRAQEGREGFNETVHAITNRKDISIGNIIWQSEWKPNIRIVNEYQKGRVFLVGDAAHIHTPAGGQGANTGMQDGANLGWKLSLVHKGLASPSLLDTYNEERHPVAKEMLIRTTNALDQMNGKHNTDKTPITQGTLLKQLSINYRWSSAVVDQQPRGPHTELLAPYLPQGNKELRAGDRAPNAPNLVPLRSGTPDNSTSTSLFDLFHATHHTLLLFDPSAEQIKALDSVTTSLSQELLHRVFILSPKNAPDCPSSSLEATVLIDVDDHAHSAYLPSRQGFPLFVVRPDGVIGAILKDVDGLQQYLGRVFV